MDILNIILNQIMQIEPQQIVGMIITIAVMIYFTKDFKRRRKTRSAGLINMYSIFNPTDDNNPEKKRKRASF